MMTNYMQLALSQAIFSIGESRPNPAVGAVVVKDGIVVGKGRTQRPGSAHAEVMALRDAGELARGAAIFVTLEPCCHYGRTPPCTKAIIDAGIRQVFFAHADPNPVVRGNSRRILEEAGIEVFEGVDACIRACVDELYLEEMGSVSTAFNPLGECRVFGGRTAAVNRRNQDENEAEGRSVFHEVERYFEAYDYFVRNKRTFVEVKSAVSEDGFMGMLLADGARAPLKITGDGAACWNHELRAMSDAVLVGTGTLLADNPSLNVRYAQGNDPVKIIWAGHHEFSFEEVRRLNAFQVQGTKLESACDFKTDAKTDDVISSHVPVVFSCVRQPNLSGVIPESNMVILTAETFAENWRQMLDRLSDFGMHRLMVEPGEGLARQLFAVATENAANHGGDEKEKCESPLWNRLDLWRSTDGAAEKILDGKIAAGIATCGLEFPELPQGVIAKESAMIGSDVLTVYYRDEG